MAGFSDWGVKMMMIPRRQCQLQRYQWLLLLLSRVVPSSMSTAADAQCR